jgi:hypothetical protein
VPVASLPAAVLALLCQSEAITENAMLQLGAGNIVLHAAAMEGQQLKECNQSHAFPQRGSKTASTVAKNKTQTKWCLTLGSCAQHATTRLWC